MPGLKTNERPGTRAVLRHSRMSAYKAREVLDLIRGQDYVRAMEILEYSERGAAEPISKLLRSCASNVEHNDGGSAEETYVSACFADEGTTLKRWRPRARGRATRIRKRTCHITVILTRLPDEELARRRAKVAAEQAERRARRVAGTRRAQRRRGGAEVAAPAGEAAAELEHATLADDEAEALAALEEAREIESESHHAELESGAESGLHLEGDEELEDEGEPEAEAASDEAASDEAAQGEASADDEEDGDETTEESE